ncbi:ATP-binding protein [Bdellovibrionota bacterium]
MKKRIKDYWEWLTLELMPKYSLRRTLTLWFLALALVPMIVIAVVNSLVYGKLLDRELENRISAANRTITRDLEGLQTTLLDISLQHSKEPYLKRLINARSRTALTEKLNNHITNSPFIDRIIAFQKWGGMLAAVSKPENGFPILPDDRYELGLSMGDEIVALELKPELVEQLENKKQLLVRRTHPNLGIIINCYTKVTRTDEKGKTHLVGFLRETVFVDKQYGSKQLKEKTGLDFVLFGMDGRLLTTTLPRLQRKKYRFGRDIEPDSKPQLISISIGGRPYVSLITTLFTNGSGIPYGFLGVIISKVKLERTLVRMRITLIIFSLILLGLVLLSVFFVTTKYLGSLGTVVQAIHKVKAGELEQKVTAKGEEPIEIRYLIESFNEMSSSVADARRALEQKVQELDQANRELVATQAQLVHSAKMVSLGQLVAGVAHELNNPIGYIYSNITHLRSYIGNIRKILDEYEKSESKLPEKLQTVIRELREKLDLAYMLGDIDAIIESCLDGAGRTKDIVTGLRNFSRLDEAEIKSVDLHEGIENTLKLLTSQLKNRITVHKKFGKLPLVTCHPSQINQVFMNMISNAAHAIKEQGDIWITTKQDGKKVVITFRDNGPGIPPENLDRIFEPFYTTKEVGTGTGLGLSISYGIIEKHGGKIEVESKPGEGTTFTIRIPIKAA